MENSGKTFRCAFWFFSACPLQIGKVSLLGQEILKPGCEHREVLTGDLMGGREAEPDDFKCCGETQRKNWSGRRDVWHSRR